MAQKNNGNRSINEVKVSHGKLMSESRVSHKKKQVRKILEEKEYCKRNSVIHDQKIKHSSASGERGGVEKK